MTSTKKHNNKQKKQKKQRGGGFFDNPFGFFSDAADNVGSSVKGLFGLKPSATDATEPTTPPPPPPPVEQANGSTSTSVSNFFNELNPFKSKPAETKPPLIGGKKKQNKTKKLRVTKK